MSIRTFLAHPEWDAPFFKRLAHNDTGRAAGHQAGMVLPKDLRQFLPTLDEGATSQTTPTTDRYLRAEMFVGVAPLLNTVLRYQFQTWGGTRSAESRITEGFQPLYHRASEGDLLVFQRRADVMDFFRVILVKQGTPDFVELEHFVKGRRWGVLYEGESPVTQGLMLAAANELTTIVQHPFEVTRTVIPRVEVRQTRIARSTVFRECVRREYARKCAVSGIAIVTPNSLHEVESAHVVPVHEGGVDDIRNGFTLTQTLHWAFDRGLFGVLSNRTVYLPRKVKRIAENAFLQGFEGKKITEALTETLRVHAAAFEWHLEHRVRQWD
jgi:putative restriction endonuclease